MNKAPNPNPMAGGPTRANPSPPVMSMAGAKRDQKLAATITPPVKPSMPSNKRRFMDLNGKTRAAPAAVMAHVKVVATKAAMTGPRPSNHVMMSFMS